MGNARMVHPKISFAEIEHLRMPTGEIWEVRLFKTEAVADSEFASCLADLQQSNKSFPNVEILAGLAPNKERQARSIGILITSPIKFDTDFLANMISVFAKTDTALMYSDYRVKDTSGEFDLHLPAWSPIRFESMDYLGQVLAFDMNILNVIEGENITRSKLVGCVLDKQLRVSRLPRVVYSTLGFEFDRMHPITEGNQANSISVVIPTKGQSDTAVSLLEECVSRLSKQNWSKELELVVVADSGYEKSVLDRVRQLWPSKWSYKFVEFDEEFNFSRKCNLGASAASGDVLIFLNDDVEIFSENALSKLADLSLRDGVGAVGSQLKFADGSIQHGGVTLQDVKPRNSYLDQLPHATVTGDIEVTHEVSAVTGACLAITRSNFEMSGGWTEDLYNSYNDVDLCLRLNALGLQTIIRNDLEILHHESVSRDSSFDEKSFSKLKSLWPTELGNEQYLRSPEALGIGYKGQWGMNKDLRVNLSGKFVQYAFHLLKEQGLMKTINAVFRRVSGKTPNLLRFESKSYL